VFHEPARPNASGCLRIDQEGSLAQGHFLARLRKPGATRAERPAPLGRLGKGQAVAASQLMRPDAAWRQLPPGELRAFGDKLHFLPEPALAALGPDFRWQGRQLARLTRTGARLHPWARCLIPPAPEAALVVDEARELEGLLSGQSLDLGGRGVGDQVPVFFRELGLGWLRLKGRRALWSDR